MYDAAVPVGATLITQGESVLSPKIKNYILDTIKITKTKKNLKN